MWGRSRGSTQGLMQAVGLPPATVLSSAASPVSAPDSLTVLIELFTTRPPQFSWSTTTAHPFASPPAFALSQAGGLLNPATYLLHTPSGSERLSSAQMKVGPSVSGWPSHPLAVLGNTRGESEPPSGGGCPSAHDPGGIGDPLSLACGDIPSEDVGSMARPVGGQPMADCLGVW